MINQPESNIKFKDADLAAIETAKVRLSSLEAEIGIATKTLGVLNKDIAKVVKDKEYQEELFVKLSKQIEDKQINLDSIESSIIRGEELLKMLRKEEGEIRAGILRDETNIKERLADLVEKEKHLESQSNELKKRAVNLAKSEELHQAKVNKLKEALKEI